MKIWLLKYEIVIQQRAVLHYNLIAQKRLDPDLKNKVTENKIETQLRKSDEVLINDQNQLFSIDLMVHVTLMRSCRRLEIDQNHTTKDKHQEQSCLPS